MPYLIIVVVKVNVNCDQRDRADESSVIHNYSEERDHREFTDCESKSWYQKTPCLQQNFICQNDVDFFEKEINGQFSVCIF